MRKLRFGVSIVAAGAVALLATTCLAAASEVSQPPANTAAATGKAARAAAAVQKRSAAALAAQATVQQKEHRVILQVNANDPALMNLVLNNATNIAQYFEKAGEPVKIEVIAFGPGLNMLREDTSPVKARIETMALSTPEVSFKACGITRDNMRKAEDKDIPIIPQAEVVPSGVVRVMQLEEDGWSYVKP